MRKYLLLCSAASALFCSSANAADLPLRGSLIPLTQQPALVLMDWSGVYVGALAGYGWSKAEYCNGDDVPPCQPLFPRHNIKGATLGGTLGVNYQFGSLVLGAEGDYSWSQIKGRTTDNLFFDCGIGETCGTELRGIGTVRGRLGYAFDRVMPYATGGAAFVNWKSGEFAGSPNNSNGTSVHFTAGLGVEYAFSSNVSAKVEYLHVFSAGKMNYDPLLSCGNPGCFSKTQDLSLVRFGLNYRFGAPDRPITAKY